MGYSARQYKEMQLHYVASPFMQCNSLQCSGIEDSEIKFSEVETT